jgi:hypothetical protein
MFLCLIKQHIMKTRFKGRIRINGLAVLSRGEGPATSCFSSYKKPARICSYSFLNVCVGRWVTSWERHVTSA